MSNVVIVGVQWGDEGKGKFVDLLALFELVLAGLVQHLVVRHDEVGLRADLEAVRGDVHALPDEGIEFFHEHDGIKDDAVSDQADFAFV